MPTRNSRLLHWRRFMLEGAAIVLLIPALFIAWMFGAFGALDSLAADWKIGVLERRLCVGERRADIESQFGQAIFKPDHLNGYGVSMAEAVPGWEDHLGEYSYHSGGSFCVSLYRGVVVFYDTHDRVKWWRRFVSGNAC